MNKLLSIILITLAILSIRAQDRRMGVTRLQDNQASEKRVALVIGNGAYKDTLLLNPTNDARDIAQMLTELGFEVIHKDNLNQIEMKKAIRSFGEKIRGGGVGLFYYAGHGMQVDGRNYLIPIGASFISDHEVEYETVDVGLVLAQMEDAGNRLNIMILDACRDNPFARSFRSAKNGLASIDAPSGTIIAYATAPGSVASDGKGKNGLYTQELLKRMRDPDLNIEQMFKQVRIAVRDQTAGKQIPWESSSLVGDFYFLSTASTSLHIVNGDKYMDKGRWADAEAEYRQTVRLEPKNPLGHAKLGDALYEQRKYNESWAEAKIVTNQNEWPKVEVEYRRALQLDPNKPWRYRQLGNALFMQQKWADAEAVYKQVVRLEPSEPVWHNYLGIALHKQDKWAQAEIEFNEAVRLAPNHPVYRANLGSVLQSQKKWPEAEREYSEAVRLNPKEAEYQKRLEQVRNKQSN